VPEWQSGEKVRNALQMAGEKGDAGLFGNERMFYRRFRAIDGLAGWLQ
jgi:hypothetical protein